MDADRQRIEFVDVKQSNWERCRVIGPQGFISTKFYFLRDVKIDLADDVRSWRLGRDIGLGCEPLGHFQQRIEIEELWGAEARLGRCGPAHDVRQRKRERNAGENKATAAYS